MTTPVGEGGAAATPAGLPDGPELPARLDALVLALAESRAMPISGALIGNRAELLALVEDVRAAVPDELYRAEALLTAARVAAERAEAEAAALVAEARVTAAALVEDHALVAAARDRAEDILAAARTAAADLLAEAEVALGRLAAGARVARAGLGSDQVSSTGNRVNPEPG